MTAGNLMLMAQPLRCEYIVTVVAHALYCWTPLELLTTFKTTADNFRTSILLRLELEILSSAGTCPL